MGLFGNIFNGNADASGKNGTFWTSLESTEDLARIIEESAQQPCVIFKHSTRCGISRMALSGFEKEFDAEAGIKAYLLDLLSHRDVSNAIASQFGVMHQSPQILLIRNGKSLYDASHGDIDATSLKRFAEN